jgi:hypothetical protein
MLSDISIKKGKKTFTFYEKSEKQRAQYTARVKRVPLSNRVYVGENGINTWFQREYARAARGMIIKDTKHGAKFNRVNIIGALCVMGNIPQLDATSSRQTANYLNIGLKNTYFL